MHSACIRGFITELCRLKKRDLQVFLQFLPVTTAGHEPDLTFEPLFCLLSAVLQLMLFWLRHTEAWISETFEGLSQINLFHLLAHPHPDLSHHQSTFIPDGSPPPTLHYNLHIPYTLSYSPSPLCQFLHLPKSNSPTSLSSWFSTPVSGLWVLLHRNTGGVWYTCVRGTGWQEGTMGHSRVPYLLFPEEQVGGSSAQQDSLFPVPLKPQLRAFKVEWMCQYLCHCMCMHACVWFPGPYVHA